MLRPNPSLSWETILDDEPRRVVLVVEDEVLLRTFASDFLDEAGFKVFEAVNADEALVVLHARPDVQAVLTDIEMPNGSMNGVALSKEVRARWPGVCIIITSGRATPTPEDDLPADVLFVRKPYSPTAVVELLQDMIVTQVVHQNSAPE
jgi:DNA-binding NtrC family response regulator